MFIWGWSTKAIDQQVSNINCSHCAHPGLIVVASQKFFDIFFIPTIPLKKYYSLICSNCGTQFQPESFDIELNDLPKSKTPWWGYSGLFILSILIAIIIFLERSQTEKTLSYLENPHINDVIVFQIKETEKNLYAVAKIKKIEGDKVELFVSKYAFSKERQAQKESRKIVTENDFSNDILEVSLEDFRKMDIKSIKRFN